MRRTQNRLARRIAGFLVLAAGGLIGLGAYTLRPRLPFDFLNTAQVVREQSASVLSPSLESRANGVYLVLRAYYTLPSDYATVRTKADRELLAKGFTIYSAAAGGRSASYSRDNPCGKTARPSIPFDCPDDPCTDTIAIERDMHYRTPLPSEPNYNIIREEQKGWSGVCVGLYIRISPVEAFMYRCWNGIIAHRF